MTSKNRPASLLAYLIFGTVMGTAMLGFLLLLRFDLQRPTEICLGDYDEPVPAGMVYQVSQAKAGKLVTFDGYVLLRGERMESVDNWVVLYDPDTDTALRLSTCMIRRAEADAAGGDGLNYQCGGFTALIRRSKLTAPRYEICVIYGANKHKIAVHTGIYWEAE